MMKSSLFTVSAIAALLCLAGCEATENSITETSKPVYSEAEESIYMARYTARQNGTARGTAGYDPLKTVPGAPNVSDIPKTTNLSISKDALEAARDYASKTDSSALIVWRDGAIEMESYFGETDETSLLNSKSLAKPISVIAVGRAIKEGHIKSLDQSVSDYITEWQDTPKAAIKVRHLLDMRSGLLPQARATGPDDVLNRAYLHPRHEDVIVHDYPLVNEPGTRYEYANATSELVAVLIERATKTAYEDWVSKEILTPLGASGGKIWMNREGGTPHSGCCILLPAKTYLRLAILYIQDGVWDNTRLLPKGFVEQVRTSTPQNPHSGMGVYIAGKYVERRGPANPEQTIGRNYHSQPYLADDLFLFDGNGHQVAYIIPSANTVVLRTGEWGPKEPEWDNSYLPNTILRGIEFPDGEGPTPQK